MPAKSEQTHLQGFLTISGTDSSFSVLIGFSAAKIFGATPILGAVIGAIMIHPDLMNGYSYGQALLDGTVPYWNVFGTDSSF